MYTVIGIGITLCLVGIAILAGVITGIKSVMNGKQDLKKIITFLVPFVVFGIAYAIAGGAIEAGIATLLFMVAAMILLIAITGLRRTFNF